MRSNTKMIRWINQQITRAKDKKVKRNTIDPYASIFARHPCAYESCPNESHYTHHHTTPWESDAVIILCPLHTYQKMNGWLVFGYHIPFDDSSLIHV